MPVAKLSTTSAPDAMRSDEGNNSLDTFIRQAIGKEHLLSFSKTGDNPLQWVQLLHGIDQPDLTGWPLLTSSKFQMQKCDKCSQEFCSPINYRRHTRFHRRSFNFEKESRKYRDLLGAYWDKLSLEEIKEVTSLNDVSLKEVSGASLIDELNRFLHRADVWTIPTVYANAGSTLLELIQAKPSVIPLSSQDLFSILDDASERTFLCAGTAESVQKYIFYTNVKKDCHDSKNVIACTCFLFEQKLMKAWLADKDAEALRCQKLLIEEEEAAKRRQTELLEKKRQKKLRQKEQKAKDQQIYEGKVNVSMTAADSLDDDPLVVEETSSPPSTLSDFNSSTTHDPLVVEGTSSPPSVLSDYNSITTHGTSTDKSSTIETIHFSLVDTDIEQLDFFNEPNPVLPTTRRQFSNSHWWQVQQSQRIWRNGISINRDHNNPTKNGKIWTKKVRVENDTSPSQGDECEMIIGCISVPVKKGITCDQLENNNSLSKKHDGTNKLWRPVSSHVGSRGRQDNVDELPSKDDNNTVIASRNCVRSFDMGNCNTNSLGKVLEVDTHGKCLRFSSSAVKEFLAQRWKEAIAADHEILVLSHVPESLACLNARCRSPKIGVVNLNWKSTTKPDNGIRKHVLKPKN
ncbi:unnamed protein product [Cuscuta epithymum]|uniref:C2H2-type domain-containing protein n=1 Tax=Cuscuta epithymum TaxID=186058 RepID=A0AAV0GIE4_9ASTE|nr:unnamed protein product [Cuscuta epithymum]CAH9147700.1 unnamed protein product [Cuscuta epithymum]